MALLLSMSVSARRIDLNDQDNDSEEKIYEEIMSQEDESNGEELTPLKSQRNQPVMDICPTIHMQQEN